MANMILNQQACDEHNQAWSLLGSKDQNNCASFDWEDVVVVAKLHLLTGDSLSKLEYEWNNYM